MPTYDYTCSECGHKMEAQQKISEPPLSECPQCHKPTLQRGVGGGVGLHFKGSGFYLTDYKNEKKPPSGGGSCGSGCGCH